jgi:heat shock protein HslJ
MPLGNQNKLFLVLVADERNDMKFINTLTVITWALVMLVACGGTSGDPLNGTTWKLYSIGQYSPVPGSTTTIRFEGGQVSGLGGCNQYGGEYKVSGQTLSFSALYMTEMACTSPAGVMKQESAYLKFLGEAQSFTVTEGRLQIYRSEGQALTFVRAQ